MISIEGGKRQARRFILAYTIRSKWWSSFQRKENWPYFVIFTATVERKTFLCTVVMFQIKQKSQDCSRFSCRRSRHSSSIMIAGLETRKTRNLQQECPCLTISNKTHAFTRWKVHFAETTRGLMRSTTLVRTTLCSSELNSARLSSCTNKFIVNSRQLTD